MGLVSLIAHVYYQEIDDIAHDSGRDTKGVPKVGAFIPCCDGQIGITKRTVPMHLSIVLDALIVCTVRELCGLIHRKSKGLVAPHLAYSEITYQSLGTVIAKVCK